MHFQRFLNDGKHNRLKCLSKLFQMLTALWRKRRWPDFVLPGGISRDSLFLVLWWWIDLSLRRDSHKYVGARPFMHLNFITVSLYWRCSFTGSHLISRNAGVMGSESIVHNAEGWIDYWLRGHESEGNNCFSKIQLVGQKSGDKTTLAR